SSDLLTSIEHLGGGGYGDFFGTRRCRQRGRTAYQRHLGTQVNQLGGKGVSHFSAGMVADVSYRVDGLAGGPCRNQRFFSSQRPRCGQMCLEGVNDLFGLGKAAFAREAAGELSRAGWDGVVAEGL